MGLGISSDYYSMIIVITNQCLKYCDMRPESRSNPLPDSGSVEVCFVARNTLVEPKRFVATENRITQTVRGGDLYTVRPKL